MRDATRSEGGEDLLRLRSSTGWAGQVSTIVADALQGLELLATAAAHVLIKRHSESLFAVVSDRAYAISSKLPFSQNFETLSGTVGLCRQLLQQQGCSERLIGHTAIVRPWEESP